jgi:hypothetical protein
LYIRERRSRRWHDTLIRVGRQSRGCRVRVCGRETFHGIRASGLVIIGPDVAACDADNPAVRRSRYCPVSVPNPRRALPSRVDRTVPCAPAVRGCSPTPFSRATIAMVRPVSITRRAASRRPATAMLCACPPCGHPPHRSSSARAVCPPDAVNPSPRAGLASRTPLTRPGWRHDVADRCPVPAGHWRGALRPCRCRTRWDMPVRGDETMKPAIPPGGWDLPRTAFDRVVLSCPAPGDL